MYKKMYLSTLLLALSSTVSALEWQQLSAQEQRVLTPFAEQWSAMDAAQQERLQAGAQRWVNMSRGQRRAAHARYSHWQQLPAQQRHHMRQRYRHFKQLPPARQRALKRVYRRFQDLPAEQRQALRQQWSQMSLQEKRAFLKSAEPGTATPGQQNAMSPDERQAFRQLAQELQPKSRRQLRYLLRHSDGPARDALKTKLESLSAAQRQTYLFEQIQQHRKHSKDTELERE